MPTTIKCLKESILNYDLAEGIAIFLAPGTGLRVDCQSFVRSFGVKDLNPQEMVVCSVPPTRGIARSLVYVDNGNKRINSIEDMQGQVIATLDKFAELGARTVAMNGIRCNDLPDQNIRPEAYQRLFVEEFVADHPDTFDVINLVDLRSGFKDPIDGIIDLLINKGWMETEYRWPPRPRQPMSEDETISKFNDYSSNLRDALDKVDNPDSERIINESVSKILNWGRIANGNLITDYSNAIKAVKRENITDLNSLLRKGGATSYKRIASWTKILAAYKPGEYFIYDSRVAIALSYISRELSLPCFWRIPSPREKTANIQNAAEREIRKKIAFEAFEKSCTNTRKADIRVCYSLYLRLLKKLAVNNRIQDAYQRFNVRLTNNEHLDGAVIRAAYTNCGFNQEQAIMAHLEKMLFMQKETIIPI